MRKFLPPTVILELIFTHIKYMSTNSKLIVASDPFILEIIQRFNSFKNNYLNSLKK